MFEFDQVPLLTANGEQKLNIVAGALIVREGKLLVVKTVDDDRWKSPGGSLHDDLSIQDNVRREVLEEVGLEIEKFLPVAPLVCLLQVGENNDHNLILIYYLVKTKAGEVRTEEGLVFEWQEIAQLDKISGSSFVIGKIKKYLLANSDKF